MWDVTQADDPNPKRNEEKLVFQETTGQQQIEAKP